MVVSVCVFPHLLSKKGFCEGFTCFQFSQCGLVSYQVSKYSILFLVFLTISLTKCCERVGDTAVLSCGSFAEVLL